MSRRKKLEARRRVLIERCTAQRAELAARFAELNPLAVLRGAGGGHGAPPLAYPLAWATALVGLLLLGRTRRIVKVVLWARSALSLATRLAQLVRLIGQLRPARGERGHGAPGGADGGPASARG